MGRRGCVDRVAATGVRATPTIENGQDEGTVRYHARRMRSAKPRGSSEAPPINPPLMFGLAV